MKYTDTLKVIFLALISLGFWNSTSAQNFCVNGCNDNTYVNSTDPNTIEYDNVVSVFHSTLLKEADGKIKVWGQGIGNSGTNTDHVLSPQILNNINYPSLTGKVLKFAAGSTSGTSLESVVQQFAVLTTDGLFIWGIPNVLLSDGIKNSNSFSKITVDGKADGLPTGVNPEDVKMMFGSYRTLSIVTCAGDAWVLSFIGNKNGDGTTENNTNNKKWHRVKTNATGNPYLTKVVAIRGVPEAFMALTSEGKVYTWGSKTYLGNNTNSSSRTYATQMTIPTGISPKMIGMTSSATNDSNGVTYYLLATNGKLYALGENGYRQLGDFTTTDNRNWVQVKKSNSTNDFLTNVVWISPQEHDGSSKAAAINVLTNDHKLWAWGNNYGLMLGLPTNETSYDPTYMPGKTTGAYDETKLNLTDNIMAVETGGHTTILIKDCSMRFGYVGHRVYGSMADGSNQNTNEYIYNFGDTSVVNLCGAPTGPITKDLRICPSTTANLNNAHLGTVPLGDHLTWYTTPNRAPGTQVPDPTAVGPGIYYAFYEPGTCPNPPGSEVHVVLIQPGDPDYETCSCQIDPVLSGNIKNTEVGISLLGRSADKVGENSEWPKIRNAGFIALESNSKGFVITRIPTANLGNISNPQEGMMVYDTTEKCLKIYADAQWKCFDTPGCP